jgi:hypothetical protein
LERDGVSEGFELTYEACGGPCWVAALEVVAADPRTRARAHLQRIMNACGFAQTFVARTR